ncbi:phage baseplate assembly protein V [Rahnella woolbedingensis]|uniref:Phage baseplate assembly protein V n=1 Tax=Rahnella woolbedingensis TaxID=1510574 RepID=A0A419N266_9GAMM|nr:phage baseplate assembly protein V [Rahnella woolbedingensis]RJT32036.1 phage baseplate assembly protein V [Rahnella woolbedingensis]
MNTSIPKNDIPRLLRNLIRIGTVAEVDLDAGTCRVNTGGNVTDWLHWLTSRAGRSRSWWAPSIGEQVLLFCLGGELDTAFVMPAVFSDEFPSPSASADAVHVTFADGAVIEYEPETGALLATGIKSATVNAADRVAVTAPQIICTATTRITLDTPEVVCTNKLTTATIEIKKAGTLTGNLTHSGGSITSNGVVVHTHKHGGVQTGGGQTQVPS